SPVGQVVFIKLNDLGKRLMRIDASAWIQSAAPSRVKTVPDDARNEVVLHAEQAMRLRDQSRSLEAWSGFLLLGALQRAGLFWTAGQSFTTRDLVDRLSVAPRFQRMFLGLLEILRSGGFVTIDREQVTVTDRVAPETVQALAHSSADADQFSSQFPDFETH